MYTYIMASFKFIACQAAATHITRTYEPKLWNAAQTSILIANVSKNKVFLTDSFILYFIL